VRTYADVIASYDPVQRRATVREGLECLRLGGGRLVIVVCFRNGESAQAVEAIMGAVGGVGAEAVILRGTLTGDVGVFFLIN